MDVRESPNTISITTVDAASEQASWAVRRYFEEVSAAIDGGFADVEQALANVDAYNAPRGLFLLATTKDAVVGCGCYQLLDPTTAEIKRMWVAVSTRGQGLGMRLLSELESEARRAGCTRAVLDTNRALDKALALYERSGYVEIDRYNDNPHAQLWFEKSLT
jgi:GNAT superfamily N-acetyltransferase